MTRNPRSGFTLLELLISMAIALTLILLTSDIYKTVNQFGNQRQNIMRDYGAEHYLRNQFESADTALNALFQAVYVRYNEFTYISRRSAQWGIEQRPVLVTYKYDAAERRIIYTEQGVYPWWGRSDDVLRAEAENMRVNPQNSAFRSTLFGNVDGFELEFWDSGKKQWKKDWSDRKIMPPVVRFKIQQQGQPYEIVLTGGVSSWSSAFGS